MYIYDISNYSFMEKKQEKTLPNKVNTFYHFKVLYFEET